MFIGLQTTLDTKVELSKDAIQAVNRIAMKLLCFWSLSGQTKQVSTGSTVHCSLFLQHKIQCITIASIFTVMESLR